MKYYMICNLGTMLHSEYAKSYPYHMVLAQMLLRSDDLFNHVMRLKETGAEIMLDNGAHENEMVDDVHYLNLINKLRPHYAVLPDMIGGTYEESFGRSIDFAHAMHDHRGLTDVRPILAVQGGSLCDVVNGYVDAFSNCLPDMVIGFGQSYLRNCFNEYQQQDEKRRCELYHTVVDPLAWSGLPTLPDRGIHILGARWRPWIYGPTTVRNSARPVRPSGIDSVKPCTSALQDRIYPYHNNPKIDLMSPAVADEVRHQESVKAFCRLYGATDAPAS